LRNESSLLKILPKRKGSPTAFSLISFISGLILGEAENKHTTQKYRNKYSLSNKFDAICESDLLGRVFNKLLHL